MYKINYKYIISMFFFNVEFRIFKNLPSIINTKYKYINNNKLNTIYILYLTFNYYSFDLNKDISINSTNNLHQNMDLVPYVGIL